MKTTPNYEEGTEPSFQLNPPQKEVRYYAKYGGTKEEVYGKTHLVSVKIRINEIEYFTKTSIKLELKQKLNQLHTFTLYCDPDEFGENKKTYIYQNTKEYLGKKITFEFRQYGKTASLFTGLITQISLPKKQGIRQLVFRGTSPEVLMESGLQCRSFENQTQEEIIKEIIKPYSRNLINFQFNPNKKERLPYTVQYNCSDLAFIQQLSERYGEYFYYNGEEYCYSSWGGRVIELMEGEDVFEYELKLGIGPQNFKFTAYDAQQKTEHILTANPKSHPGSTNPFQQHALAYSKNLYHTVPQFHYEQSLLPNGSKEMEDSMEVEKKKRQNLVYVEGVSNNPQLRIGDVAKMMVWIPEHEIFKDGRIPIESYKIIEIEHRFADGEGYENTFTGIPKDMTVPPFYNGRAYPKASIQHATVTDNQDPLKMGRVRVQFSWQKESNSQTPWIQVIQPHAGGGKGTYMNPEKGETVLCAFQGGNAEAPVVLGTAYNGGEIAAYYSEGNDIKVIQTRSGTKIIFNDSEGTILMEDPSGNRIFLDGKGNIKVYAPETLYMDARNISVNASQNITMNAGENVSLMVGEDYSLTAANIYEAAGQSRTSDAKNITETSSKDGKYSSEDENIKFESVKAVTSNSAEDTTLH